MSDSEAGPKIYKYAEEKGEETAPLGQQALDRITNAKEISKQDLRDLLAARVFILKRIGRVDSSIDGVQSTGHRDQGAYAAESSSVYILQEELGKIEKHLKSIGYNIEKGRFE